MSTPDSSSSSGSRAGSFSDFDFSEFDIVLANAPDPSSLQIFDEEVDVAFAAELAPPRNPVQEAPASDPIGALPEGGPSTGLSISTQEALALGIVLAPVSQRPSDDYQVIQVLRALTRRNSPTSSVSLSPAEPDESEPEDYGLSSDEEEVDEEEVDEEEVDEEEVDEEEAQIFEDVLALLRRQELDEAELDEAELLGQLLDDHLAVEDVELEAEFLRLRQEIEADVDAGEEAEVKQEPVGQDPASSSILVGEEIELEAGEEAGVLNPALNPASSSILVGEEVELDGGQEADVSNPASSSITLEQEANQLVGQEAGVSNPASSSITELDQAWENDSIVTSMFQVAGAPGGAHTLNTALNSPPVATGYTDRSASTGALSRVVSVMDPIPHQEAQDDRAAFQKRPLGAKNYSSEPSTEGSSSSGSI